MIKRTLYFGSPAKLATKDNQLIIQRDNERNVRIPIEDIGFIILDHYAISISKTLLSRCVENNTAILTADDKHMPNAWFMPLEGNAVQQKHFRIQMKAGVPLKKRLWKQTILAKIKNQSDLLKSQSIPDKYLIENAKKVKSGDPGNIEGRVARYYWQRLFNPFSFKRERFGGPPNNLLNYGYAILRAVIARAIVGSGLLPSLGIHHKSQYNPFPLADDIMEPYRPMVDELVLNMVLAEDDYLDLTPETKKTLLQLPVMDVKMGKNKKPLMIAASSTTSSLVRCFMGEDKKIIYPTLCH
ncbi:MAG: type II CRISPR-associated endonuclease Cas1 [Candidatus Marinimicrobia bacterium]|nr:type II CRISPR-associated endonuclease Cas1 [Candidatus Neomarinimicrobiota bacterium]